jgi:hypothetical protein
MAPDAINDASRMRKGQARWGGARGEGRRPGDPCGQGGSEGERTSRESGEASVVDDVAMGLSARRVGQTMVSGIVAGCPSLAGAIRSGSLGCAMAAATALRRAALSNSVRTAGMKAAARMATRKRIPALSSAGLLPARPSRLDVMD